MFDRYVSSFSFLINQVRFSYLKSRCIFWKANSRTCASSVTCFLICFMFVDQIQWEYCSGRYFVYLVSHFNLYIDRLGTDTISVCALTGTISFFRFSVKFSFTHCVCVRAYVCACFVFIKQTLVSLVPGLVFHQRSYKRIFRLITTFYPL